MFQSTGHFKWVKWDLFVQIFVHVEWENTICAVKVGVPHTESQDNQYLQSLFGI